MEYTKIAFLMFNDMNIIELSLNLNIIKIIRMKPALCRPNYVKFRLMRQLHLKDKVDKNQFLKYLLNHSIQEVPIKHK